MAMESSPRPLPAGVTDLDAVLSDREVDLILEGLMKPSPNAIHALAREVKRGRVLKSPAKDDL